MDDKGKHINMKEDILRALEGKSIMLCPYCKHRVFLRKTWARVEITEDYDSLLDNLVEGFEEHEYVCAKCDEDVLVEDMIKKSI